MTLTATHQMEFQTKHYCLLLCPRKVFTRWQLMVKHAFLCLVAAERLKDRLNPSKLTFIQRSRKENEFDRWPMCFLGHSISN